MTDCGVGSESKSSRASMFGTVLNNARLVVCELVAVDVAAGDIT